MEQDPAPDRHQQKPKILIVDDDEKNRYLLEVIFNTEGYDVVPAKNGIDALAKLKNDRFIAIISDILMPGMDGFRLIRECKNDPALQEIPFIFYSATYTDRKDEVFGLSLGAERYIIKPKEPEELIRLFKEVLEQHNRSSRDYTQKPVIDDETFTREYSLRVGAKMDKKVQLLKETEQKYQLLFENINDAVFIHEITGDGKPGRLIEVNRAACEVLGYLREELLNMTMQDIISEQNLPAADSIRHALIQEGVTHYEGVYRKKDGTYLPVEVRLRLFEYQGTSVAISSVRDITERKRAEEEMQRSFERFRTVLDSLDALVYVADIQTYDLLFINKYGKDIWGDVEGKVCWQSIQSDQTGPCSFCTNDRLVDKDGHSTGVYRWEFKNTITGKWYDCRDRAIRWLDGRLVRIEIATDITPRKEAEMQVKHAVGQITSNMEQMAILNDSIRNPLAVIVAATDLEGGEYAKKILTSAHEIDKIIAMLDSGWIQSEKVRNFLKTHYKFYEEEEQDENS
jgi:PAS domain S-box